LRQIYPNLKKIFAVLSRRAVEYDRRREEAAEELGIRVGTLDQEVEKRRPRASGSSTGGGTIILSDPAPWPDPVSGANLLDAVRKIFESYLILPPGASTGLSLFVAHSYVLQAAEVSPILAITSPEKRCGKSNALRILQALVYRALPTSNITPAALFRTIEACAPALLLDEADSFLPENEELRGVLNSGHERAMAVIIRTIGDNHEPKQFSTWCPKVIASIGKLPGTIADRSITISMRRKTRADRVERLRCAKLSNQTANLRRMAARWAIDNLTALRETDPDVPAALHDRAADCWRPLLAIAEVAGGDWLKRAHDAALLLTGENKDDSITIQFLSDIPMIFRSESTDKIFSETLVGELIKIEDRPWPELKAGKPMSKTQLARQLNRFDVIPKSIRIGEETAKGYELKQFDDPFSRYLDSQTVTTSQATSNLNASLISKSHTEFDVTFSKPSHTASAVGCDDVTFPEGEEPEEERI
jgi:putative DNA primase/helicase